MNILHILPLEPDDMDREDRRTVKPPILLNKQYAEPTAFVAENLLRKARRQKSLARVNVPRICILDPDGDIVRWLVRTQGLECDAGGHAITPTCINSHTRELVLVSSGAPQARHLPSSSPKSCLLPAVNCSSA